MRIEETFFHVLLFHLTEQYHLHLDDNYDGNATQEEFFFSANSPVEKFTHQKRDSSASDKLEHPDCVLEVFTDIQISDKVVSEVVLRDKVFFKTHFGLQLLTLKTEDQLVDAVKTAMSNHPHVKSVSIRFQETLTDLIFSRKETQIILSKIPVAQKKIPFGWTPLQRNCRHQNWQFGYSFIYSNNESSHMTIYFNLDELKLEINQCDSKLWPLLKSHPNCDNSSTECQPLPQNGFSPGGFQCICRSGFYFPVRNSSHARVFPSAETDLEESIQRCLPCPSDCIGLCTESSNCTVSSNTILRTTVLSVHLLFMLLTSVLAVIVFKTRKCKTVAAGMWTILEIILFGCFILYSTVLARWFSPSTKVCLIEPWCREIGFVVCYGAIILKLYRILIEFRTRKAHRWVVRDKDLLKYLLGMVIVVFGYMSAWTAMNLNLIQGENYSMVTVGAIDGTLEFSVCKTVWWDYVTQTGEMCILIFGMHLSYASRNAKSQFQERRFLFLAIAVETVISGIFYILRFLFWASMDPDTTLLIYFIRSHLTTSVIIIVIFFPKWWYQQFEVNKSKVTRHYLTQESGRGLFEAFKSQGISATNSDVECEVNLAEMNPEDIRAELKRLYTQLEVLKNKTIRLDNPHISKRRGGRKIAHRRFSLQKKGSKDKSSKQQSQKSALRQEPEITEAEHSRTPEESICSNEGPSVILNDGPSEVLHSTPNKHLKP